MAGSFIAKYRTSTPCKVCGNHVEVGEKIVWSRRNRGVFYHEHCYLGMKDTPVLDGWHSVPSVTPVAPIILDTPSVSPAAPISAPASRCSLSLSKNAPWNDVLEAVLPVTNRVLLIGPPSSGKSTTAMILAGTKHRITMTETTSREDLIGMFHLIANETKWVDGPVATAMRNGEAVLFDEVDRYSPECASLFYSLIDDKPHISLPTGELLEAKDGYKVIMTTNETLETLPPAVQDRIEVIINADVPHKAVIADLPKHAQEVVLCWYKTQPTKNLTLPPTVRRMKAFTRLTSIGISDDIAANLVFGNAGGREVLSTLTSAQSNY